MAREGHSKERKSLIATKAFHISKMMIEQSLLDGKIGLHDLLETTKDSVSRA